MMRSPPLLPRCAVVVFVHGGDFSFGGIAGKLVRRVGHCQRKRAAERWMLQEVYYVHF
jgi:hypothetical protein